MNHSRKKQKNMKPLILASASSHRRRQLQQLQVKFSHHKAAVDESLRPQESPQARAVRLAAAKAESVRNQFPEAVVIGSDQVCSCDQRVYHKPGNRDNNIQQLTEFSAREVFFYTAVCVIDSAGERRQYVNNTQVQFRPLSESEIIRYVDKEQAFDCAGGFKMEQLGLSLMVTVKSDDPSALVGLPLIQLCGFLREFGFELP